MTCVPCTSAHFIQLAEGSWLCTGAYVVGHVSSGIVYPTFRPPNAFTRKRDFSAAEPGHVVLLEYMEQQAS